MHEYDTVLKALLQGSGNSVLEQISGTRVARWLRVELPQVQNPRMDLLGETILAELLHLELQSTNDPQMTLRMAEYRLRAFRLYGRAVAFMDHDLIGPAIRKGIQEGLQQGLQQGRFEGQREVIRRLIEKRFGAMPALTEQASCN